MSRPAAVPPPAPPAIRIAVAADLEPLAALEAAGFGSEAWSRRLLREELDAPSSLVLVAERRPPPSEALGLPAYACFRRTAGEAELLRVATEPAARRSGLARTLIAAGLERLRDEGTIACFLEVSERNAAAIALYAGLGFREVGRRRDYYPGGVAALQFRLDLGAPTG